MVWASYNIIVWHCHVQSQDKQDVAQVAGEEWDELDRNLQAEQCIPNIPPFIVSVKKTLDWKETKGAD